MFQAKESRKFRMSFRDFSDYKKNLINEVI